MFVWKDTLKLFSSFEQFDGDQGTAESSRVLQMLQLFSRPPDDLILLYHQLQDYNVSNYKTLMFCRASSQMWSRINVLSEFWPQSGFVSHFSKHLQIWEVCLIVADDRWCIGWSWTAQCESAAANVSALDSETQEFLFVGTARVAGGVLNERQPWYMYVRSRNAKENWPIKQDLCIWCTCPAIYFCHFRQKQRGNEQNIFRLSWNAS